MNVLLITADTLRADHLSCYGYWRRTSPNLDRLADEGIRFESFIGQCAHTLPSFTSMMTGKTPFETGVVATLHCVPDTPSGRLSDTTPVLAELLATNGVHTYAVDNLMNFACHPSWFVRGFGEYCNPNPESFVADVLAGRVNEVLLPLLDRVREPFFLWAHYWDVHRPYNQPDEFLAPFDPADGDDHIAETPDGRRCISRWGTLEALDASTWANGAVRDQQADRIDGARAMINAYDGEILYLDSRLGDVFERLQQLGKYDDTCVLFTADHGETMADHLTHFCHCQALDACTHIPFIVKPPKGLGAKPGAVPDLATHTDITPTVLDIFGVQTDVEMEGRSLVPVFERSAGSGRNHVVSSGMQLLDEGLWKSIEVSARTARWRLVRKARLEEDYPQGSFRYAKHWEIITKLYEREPPIELFDTASDPDEQTDVSGAHPNVVTELSELLRPPLDSPYFYGE